MCVSSRKQEQKIHIQRIIEIILVITTIPFHAGAFALAGLTLTLTTGMAVVGSKGVPQTECPISPKKFIHFNTLLSSCETHEF